MATLTEEELAQHTARAVRDEIERCALLVEMRADISRKSAAKLRKDGSYKTWSLWPPFKSVTLVAPKWERNASLFDDVARAFDVVAHGIRAGWDPRDLYKPSPDERIKPSFPCFNCPAPMDCGSWQCCERGHGDWR